MKFEIIGDITEVETIATGGAIRELPRLQKVMALVVGEK